jgi:hypothetical protein
MASASMSSGAFAVPRPRRTKPVSAAQVRSYAAKAEEFAEAAVSDLAAGRNIAATRLAIHAGINSADAVCGARLGKRVVGDDHDEVLVLLRQTGAHGAEVERDLRRLMPLKTRPSTTPTTSHRLSRPRRSSEPSVARSSPVGSRPRRNSGPSAQRRGS